jgi:hypothetical protein
MFLTATDTADNVEEVGLHRSSFALSGSTTNLVNIIGVQDSGIVIRV